MSPTDTSLSSSSDSSSTGQSHAPRWTNHVEHRLAADLWLNRHLRTADERALSLMVTSFSYRSLVSAHRARLQSHLGWDDARYEASKCSMLLDSWVWTWEGSLTARTHDEGWWAWRDGRDQVDATLARPEMRFPDHWLTSPQALASRRLYAQRVGMKHAARLFPHDSSEARITLATLATSLRYDQPEAWTPLTPWMCEVLAKIDVRSSVRKLERWGYVEVDADRTHLRYTTEYAAELARYEEHWGGRGRTNRETLFEEQWTAAHHRPEWRGAEKKARGPRWYFYAIETTTDLTIEVDESGDEPVREHVPVGSTVYIGITTLPEMRNLEHWDASSDGKNSRLEALKRAAESVNRDHPAIKCVPIEDHDAEQMSWVEAQKLERFLVQSYAAQGHPLLNIQYLMPGRDWVTGGDHTSQR